MKTQRTWLAHHADPTETALVEVFKRGDRYWGKATFFLGYSSVSITSHKASSLEQAQQDIEGIVAKAQEVGLVQYAKGDYE
jgi:hypothetical protein